jgi:aminopeptidase YwaD
MIKKLSLILVSLFLFACSEQVKVTTGGINQMRSDIQYLASDELEGRDTGTEGEAKAAAYIAMRFADLGLTGGANDGSFYQVFEFTGSPILNTENTLMLNYEAIADSLFYPLNFSGSNSMKGKAVNVGFGILAPDLGYDDYKDLEVKGNPVIIDVSSPDGIHPHSEYLAFHDLRDRAEKAQELGATAVIFYTQDKTAQAPSKTLTENVIPLTIPVVYASLFVSDHTEVTLNMVIDRPKLQGKNVLAFLDKGKERNIVIGAHYDHLGFGGSGSLHRGEKAIHNGADDNASGVAAMLQLALDLQEMPLEHNVLFIGFSGEERGLLGSNHWVKNPTMALDKIEYMMNMDMVGRLDTSKHKLSVNGVGTSPSWSFIDKLDVGGLSAVTTEAGTGPSDHMSFYLSDLPVLHFFSGSHEDYHKPSDDEGLINYEGIVSIVNYMEAIVKEVDDDGVFTFTKTKEEKKEAANFKVTLGIIPDYLFEEKGMRVDGVTEGRPGDKAGMLKGDIIIGMGERSVNDIYAYMEALGSHNTGDQTDVKVLRDAKEVILKVTFD